MITADIPGFGELRLEHLVLDYNGTLARDGALDPGIAETLTRLSRSLRLHVVTADTFGKARDELARLPLEVVVLQGAQQADAKAAFVRRLGAAAVVAIGNGRNDRKMLREAALGIAVGGPEGCAVETLRAATIVTTAVEDALTLLERPRRLLATLRD